MADVNLTTQEITRAGITPAYTAITATTDTYKFLNDGDTYLHFKKTGAGASTVTIVTPRTVEGLAVADLTLSVPATSGDKMVGPFPRDSYNDPDGKVAFTHNEGTGLSVAVLQG